MNRPRLNLGLDGSRPTLNQEICARIGRELKAIRERRGLTIEQVGATLLLASCQVSALEAVQLWAFYGAEFYVAALKKYVVLMDLDVADVDRALVRAIQSNVPLPLEGNRKTVPPVASRLGPSKRMILAAAALVAVGVGSVFLAAVRHRSAVASTGEPRLDPHTPVVPSVSPEPSAPAVPDVADPAGVALSDAVRLPALGTLSDDRSRVQATAALAITAAPAASAGRVRVGRPTWVFVRYANGTTLERVLGRGEELTFEAPPTYLAVGLADETVVEIDGQAIDNSQFIVDGALRVGSSQLAQLVAHR